MNGKGNGPASIGTDDGGRKSIPHGNARTASIRAPVTKRTVVYARSRTGEDIDRQVEMGLAYAFQSLGVGPEAVVVLTDLGGAMGLDRCRRPGVGELLSRIAEFDRIVVVGVDRLHRDPAALDRFNRLLVRNACELHSTTAGRVAAEAMSISGYMTASMAMSGGRMRRIAAGLG